MKLISTAIIIVVTIFIAVTMGNTIHNSFSSLNKALTIQKPINPK